VLFVADCEENQVRFHPRFDLIILLSAPAEVLAGRLASRTTNSFGPAPGELNRVLDDLQAVELLLRKAATHEIWDHHAAPRGGRGGLAPSRCVSNNADGSPVRPRGLSPCRFCGRNNGHREFTDGTYQWPEGA